MGGFSGMVQRRLRLQCIYVSFLSCGCNAGCACNAPVLVFEKGDKSLWVDSDLQPLTGSKWLWCRCVWCNAYDVFIMRHDVVCLNLTVNG